MNNYKDISKDDRKYIISPHKRPTILYTVARIVVIYLATDMQLDAPYTPTPFELLDVIQVNMAIICLTAIPITSRVRKAVRVSHTKNQSTAGLGSYSHSSNPSSR